MVISQIAKTEILLSSDEGLCKLYGWKKGYVAALYFCSLVQSESPGLVSNMILWCLKMWMGMAYRGQMLKSQEQCSNV